VQQTFRIRFFAFARLSPSPAKVISLVAVYADLLAQEAETSPLLLP
jgi:hypothetical protein